MPSEIAARNLLFQLLGICFFNPNVRSPRIALGRRGCNGDGVDEIAMWNGFAFLPNGQSGRVVGSWSIPRQQFVRQVAGSEHGWGNTMLGDLDTDGDGLADFITCSDHVVQGSTVFVYDAQGNLRYTIPCHIHNRVARSLGNMGDLDGDGCDVLLLGICFFNPNVRSPRIALGRRGCRGRKG